MKYIEQFAVILAISFVGELMHSLIPLPIPAGIYGLILMLVLLGTGLLPLQRVRDTGRFLIEIMPVMFIPSAVGLIDSWGVLAPMAIKLILITVVTTFAVMAVSGHVTQAVIQLEKTRRKETTSK